MKANDAPPEEPTAQFFILWQFSCMWIAYDINMIPNAYVFVETWYKYQVETWSNYGHKVAHTHSFVKTARMSKAFGWIKLFSICLTFKCTAKT